MKIGAAQIREARGQDFIQAAHLISDAHRAAGTLDEHYEPWAVEGRLSDLRIAKGILLVADIEGGIVACGGIVPASFARHTWTLCLGATRPDLQGHGLGHQLVTRRLDIAAREGAGIVLVSSVNPARWARYGFKQQFVNPVTGAHLMALRFDNGRH